MRHFAPVLAAALTLTALPSSLPAQHAPEAVQHGDKRPDRVELASSEVVIPMTVTKGRPVVEVSIDGKGPFPFVLDTGAGGTVLGEELARELALPAVGEVRIGDPIKPHAIAAKQVRIDRLAVGGATFSGLVATSMGGMDMQKHLGARGILGMPLFADLLLTLDYGRGQVRVTRGALPPPDGRDVVAYGQGFGGAIRVRIRVGDLEVSADLDSGSPSGVSLPETYIEKLPLEGTPVEVGRARTVNSEFVVRAATLKGAVRIGGHTLEAPELRFNGLPVANLGGQVLARFAVTIDQNNRRIRFLAAPEPAAAAGAPGSRL